MKSSQQQLSSRGFLPKETVLEKLEKNDLFTQLSSSDPVQRSIAARCLGTYYILLAGTAERLLEHLCIEKKLYTRIEICDALAKGDTLTVHAMIPYLNKLGNNQYRSLTDAKTSKKKCYPLPRGIIARTFGRMDLSVADILLDNLNQKEYTGEMIDGLGYLIANNPTLQTISNYERAKVYYLKYKTDKLFVWKFVIFSSAFPYAFVEKTLAAISKEFPEQAIQREIERTIVISKRH
ncbi:hypothetical protein [Candidatus Enterococcus clewellii]|uniref:Uncharacterized protein n=1 Tax=Candidatus Enterococcus clewellii TaxID=1834193 RepID=A0A242KDB3_9ENTE|nr:hypothetical protein [Enterococcus sp. 9E7_DIV0242]OTP19142.1 hypothetical protein A5888_000956 [Enterococcus sp. 9E7_DIV0242]